MLSVLSLMKGSCPCSRTCRGSSVLQSALQLRVPASEDRCHDCYALVSSRFRLAHANKYFCGCLNTLFIAAKLIHQETSRAIIASPRH